MQISFEGAQFRWHLLHRETVKLGGGANYAAWCR